MRTLAAVTAITISLTGAAAAGAWGVNQSEQRTITIDELKQRIDDITESRKQILTDTADADATRTDLEKKVEGQGAALSKTDGFLK